MDADGEVFTLYRGDTVRVRPIRATDGQKLVEGFSRLSAESRFRRFLGGPNLTDAAVRYLTHVDGHDHVALVAVKDTPDLKDEIGLGVARYVRLRDEPDTAEAAITVIDDYQARGVGTALAVALYAEAVRNGIRRFRAEVLSSNEPMLTLLASFDAIERSRSEDTIVFDIPLVPLEMARGHRSGLVPSLLRGAAETMAFVARTLRHLGAELERPA